MPRCPEPRRPSPYRPERGNGRRNPYVRRSTSGQLTREGYSGSEPGVITPDGCAVELYSRLSAGNEPDVIEAAAPAGARILELGCGTGRVTRPLVERGFDVTAIPANRALPRNANGKVMKRQLREAWAAAQA